MRRALFFFVAAAAAACVSYALPGRDVAASADAGEDASVEPPPPPQSDASDAGSDCSSHFDVYVPFTSPADLADFTIVEDNGQIVIGPPEDGGKVDELVATGTVPDGGSVTAKAERTFAFVPMHATMSFQVRAPKATKDAQIGCSMFFTTSTAESSIGFFANGTSFYARRDDGPMLDLGRAAFETDLTIQLETTSEGALHAEVRSYGVEGVPIGRGDAGDMLPGDLRETRIACGIVHADSPGEIDVAVRGLSFEGCY